MSFAYAVYEDKVNKDTIRFYHCSNKRSNVRTIKTPYPPGSILDSDQEQLYIPEYYMVDKIAADDSKTFTYFKIHDCTIINIFNMEGEWYYGTKNSWNIKNLRDFSQSTYGEFFTQCLQHYPAFTFDMLDATKMYTVIFTNPECHFMATEYKVYVYRETDPLADVFDILDQTTNMHECVKLCNETGEIQILQPKLRESATGLLYNNRNRCYAKEIQIACAKIIISALCNSAQNVRSDVLQYYTDHLNQYVKPIFDRVVKVANDFELENAVKDRYLNVDIPTDLINLSQENTIYHPKHIGFFVAIYRATLDV